MAKIPLRTYIQDIEKMVENGRIDEAVAHCRYLLQFYPKYVDVYRLLGKAYLESQRFGDASDIFQRVLSAVPEDFISHVGMSMIREDEGNLDEAIWHMERAFENQPANNAIQDELRRLYGRRDGIEPPKIRLTRGALARMYYRGDLHQQAIAELSTTLAEASNRLDLLALLASVYARAGQRAEAVEAASGILRKLPHCMAATQIMVGMLAGTERDEEAKAFRQRLSQLDPYAAFLSPQAPTIESVPDAALNIEKLDWKPGETPVAGMLDSGQPAWASSLGLSIDQPSGGSGEALPAWLADISPESDVQADTRSGATAFSGPFDASDETGEMPGDTTPEGASITPEDQIPDWMKDLGWVPGTGEAEKAEASYIFEEDEEPLAVSDELVAGEIPDWLQAMAPPQESETPQPDETDEEDVSSWLENLLPGAAAGVAAVGAAAAADWLSKDDAEETPSSDTLPPAEETPDWLSGYEELTGVEGLPDWLAPAATAGAAAATSELPDWLSSTQEAEEPQAEEPAEAEPAEELPAWLMEEQPAEEGGEEAAPAEGLPDWLAPAAAAGAAAAVASELPDWLSETEETAEPQAEAAPAEEFPAWLMEEQPTEEPATEAAPAEALPAWLMEEQPAEEEAGEAAPAEGLPDWLAPAAAAGVAAATASELPDWLSETEETAEPQAEAAPAEEFPAWLMEEQPAEEEGEEAAPAEGLPDWLAPAAAAGAAAAVASELPDWLSDTEEPESQAEEPTKAAPAEEIPAWLMEEQPAEEGGEEAAPAEGLPDWLAPAAAAGAAAAVANELPDWLGETEEVAEPQVEGPAAQAETPTQPEAAFTAGAPLDDLDTFAWLESLAVKQGASEALLLKPEERTDKPPEWIHEAGPQAEGAEPEIVAEAPQSVGEPGTAPIAEEAPVQPPEEAISTEEVEEIDISVDTDELQTALAWLVSVSAPPRTGEPEEPVEATPEIIEEKVAPEPTGPPAASEIGAPLDDLDTFAWLESLAVKQGASEALLLKPEDRVEAPPEWVKETVEEAAEPEAEVEEQLQPEAVAQEPAPLPKEPPAAPVPPETHPAGEAGIPLDDLDTFAWLESLAVKQGASEALLLKPEDRVEAPPEWVQEAALHPDEETASPEAEDIEDLYETEAEEVEAEEPIEDEGETQPPPSSDQPGVPLDDEAAFAWLETLAVSQGANEALLLKPEDRTHTPPDWVLETAEEGEELIPEGTPGDAEVPWTDMIQEAAGPESSAPSDAEKSQTGELSLVEQARMMAEEISASSMLGLEEEEEEELIDWVTKPDSLGSAATPESQTRVPDLPSWLAGSISEPSEELEWTPPPIAPRRYDLNKATLAELERLPGIGFIMAQQIITHREANGPFTEIDQLTQVSGFIESMLDPVREYLYTDYVAPTPPPEVEPLSFSSALAAPPDLVQARDAVLAGDLDQAMRRYAEMIQENQLIDAIISDLQEASARYPNHMGLWQNLGDAYLRVEQTRQALEAYVKAERLLR